MNRFMGRSDGGEFGRNAQLQRILQLFSFITFHKHNFLFVFLDKQVFTKGPKGTLRFKALENGSIVWVPVDGGDTGGG